MPDFSVQIPAEEMANLLSAQILSQLTEDAKNVLIQTALKHLMHQPSVGRYGEKEDSPLQAAFKVAMTKVATSLAQEIMAEEAIAANVKASLLELIEHVPHIKDDWPLQRTIWQAMLDRAEEIKNENRGY
jgi:uncharacterized membrane-anchored protein YjiN (DUF445 family)